MILALRYDIDTVGDYIFDPLIFDALQDTLIIAAVAMVLGVLLGTLLGVMRTSSNPVAGVVSGLYVWFWRGTPVILQLLLLYFGLRQIIEDDWFRDNWTRVRAGIIILGLNEAAYMAEIVRAGIRSVDPGQMDAAKSLGMTNLKATRRIILPQAIRTMVPPTGNEFIAMLKNTSVLFAIGVVELLNAVKIQAARNFQPMEMYTVAAIWYLVIVTLFSFVQAEIERHLAVGDRDQPETLLSRVIGVMGGGR